MSNEEKDKEVSNIEDELYYVHYVITFEIDTGAGVSIISEEHYKKISNMLKLLPTNAQIRTYSNEPLCILGTIKLDVTINKTHKQLQLYAIKGTGTNLLGRNWLNVIRLDWNKVVSVSSM